MNKIKRIVYALVFSSIAILTSCSNGNDNDSIASVSVNLDGSVVNCIAAAKLSNAEDAIPVVSKIFGESGTLIYGIDIFSGQKVYITYAGQSAGTYKTGVDLNSVESQLLNFLVGGDANATLADSVKNAVKTASNVTFTDAAGNKWYSTSCSVVITSQVKGDRATLINGTFSAKVYKDASTSKTISGVIANVIGF